MMNKLTHFSLPWDINKVVQLEFEHKRKKYCDNYECIFIFTNEEDLKFHVKLSCNLRDVYTIYYASVREMGWED